jgi:hypothetical protein
MAASKVQVNTWKWEFSNSGAKPRGHGYWAFEIGGEVKFYRGQYSECKAQAQKEAAELGIAQITLLP